MFIHNWQNDNYLISTDQKKLDHLMIHRFLTTTYWASGRTLEEVSCSIENAICFGVYTEEQSKEEQIGFARVITDFVTFAYLSDLFILPAHRGKKLGKWLVESILSLPELQKGVSWLLLTKDAQWLYQSSGFRRFHSPDSVMVKPPKSLIG